MFQNKIISGLFAMAAFMGGPQEVDAKAVCPSHISLYSMASQPDADTLCSMIHHRHKSVLEVLEEDLRVKSAGDFSNLNLIHFPSREALTQSAPSFASRGIMIPGPVNYVIFTYDVIPKSVSKGITIDGPVVTSMIRYANLFHEYAHFIFYSFLKDYKQSKQWMEHNGFVLESLEEGLAEMYMYSSPVRESKATNSIAKTYISLLRYPIDIFLYSRFSLNSCPTMQRVFFDKSLPRSDFINYFCSAFYLRFLKMQQPEFYGFLLHSIREGDVSQDFPFQKAFSSVQLQSQANQFSKLVVSHFNQGMYDQVPIVFGPEEK